jgi:hypothetical protein
MARDLNPYFLVQDSPSFASPPEGPMTKTKPAPAKQTSNYDDNGLAGQRRQSEIYEANTGKSFKFKPSAPAGDRN